MSAPKKTVRIVGTMDVFNVTPVSVERSQVSCANLGHPDTYLSHPTQANGWLEWATVGRFQVSCANLGHPDTY
ncbi:MAG: hypothetical protein ACRD28_01130, partial [Acidobacteriaceae bacterium]